MVRALPSGRSRGSTVARQNGHTIVEFEPVAQVDLPVSCPSAETFGARTPFAAWETPGLRQVE